MTNLTEGETTRGRNDSGRNDSGRTGKWRNDPLPIGKVLKSFRHKLLQFHLMTKSQLKHELKTNP